jgi:hypothetical protein
MIKSLFRKFPFIKYFAYKYFVKHGFSTIPNDFRERKLKQIGNTNVLFFSERYWPVHNAWELYIAKLIETENYKVTILICDGLNSFCDSHSLDSVIQKDICKECKFNVKKLCISHGIEYVSMNDYLNKNNTYKSINSPIDNFTDTELNNFVECSVVRHLRSNQKNDFNWQNIESKFKKSLRNTDNFLKIFLYEHQFDYFFVLNGQFANSKLFTNYAKLLGKQFITYERGNIKNTLVFSKNKNAVPFDMSYIINNSNININYQLLNNYLQTRSIVGNGHVPFYTEINDDIDTIKKNLGINNTNKTFVLFTNLIWDSSVYGQDTIFQDMYDWINKTIDFFILNSNLTLVIRIHPAEEKITWWKTRFTTEDSIKDNFSTLPNNIKIIKANDTTSSYSLMKITDVGLVYTSTTGLEMALENKPVIMAASAHYSNLNLVYEPKDIKEYYSLMKKTLLPFENQIDKIQKYLYLLYFEKMIKLKDIDESITYNYKINSFKNFDKDFKNKLLKVFND